MGLPTSQSIQSYDDTAPIGLVRDPLCRFLLTKYLSTQETNRLWGIYATALPDPNKSARKSSHRLQLPYRVSPIQHRKLSITLSASAGKVTVYLLLPRFFPLQRFASHGEPHTPVSPNSSG